MKKSEKCQNPKLRSLLLKMMATDQKYRRTMSFARVDKNHVISMRRIIKRYGWPTFTMVGKDGAQAAWLLIQHADCVPRFQASCLRLLEKAVKSKEAESSDLAYLIDRVLVNTHKKQVYGTQFYNDTKGTLVPRPIINKKLLAHRRKQMGLGSFTAYQRRMRQCQKMLNTTKYE